MNTKVDEGKLISGKEALIALLQGKKVELLCDIGWDEITNLKDWDIKEFTENYPKYEFRLASSAMTDEGKHWISVDDQMPEDLDSVDLLINAERRLTDCTYIDNKFYTHQFKDEYWTEIKNNVTHWMPLPAPPVQGESHE